MGGGRVSGKAGKFNVGLLNMQTSDYNDTVASTNFSVARVSRDLPNRSSIGAHLHQPRRRPAISPATTTTAAPSASTASSASAMTTMVSGFVARTETPGVDDSDHAYNLRSQTNRPQWDLNVGYQEVGNGFNPAIGFLSRRGYRKPDVEPDDALPSEGLHQHPGAAPALDVPRLLGPRRLPGNRLPAPRQPLAVPRQHRDSHRHEPDARRRAHAVRDLSRRLRAAGHLRSRRGAAGGDEQPGRAVQRVDARHHRRLLRRRSRGAQPDDPHARRRRADDARSTTSATTSTCRGARSSPTWCARACRTRSRRASSRRR